ncbi:hypothetical protein [Actinoalloteichus hymeniacidonis]|uniref:Uncharacterized protein n=1 Tax=Actinoalloteichus hymeniacidonis TaxID=340345 RepID=A0AAC9MYR7_9PSEU|nr:hypothetical protein [Actinoalloteichus hymeniacidonis]AOS63734.1 hypothetical protein TL08_14625 [Actinoalloteichus hymeniacidonis]MBB5908212.1 hypothetical protein [Actinoalloteichus hymeniacidonis]
MAHKFTLALSREITDDELTKLRQAGSGEATASTTTLPTNPDVTVGQLDFDVEGESLSGAIDAALAAIKTIPDLGVPGLSVPAQPTGASDGGAVGEESPAAELASGGQR